MNNRVVSAFFMTICMIIMSLALSSCSQQTSDSSAYAPSNYDGKYDASEMQGARDVWNSINGSGSSTTDSSSSKAAEYDKKYGEGSYEQDLELYNQMKENWGNDSGTGSGSIYGSSDSDTSYDSDTSSAEEEYDAKYGEGSFDQDLELYNEMKENWGKDSGTGSDSFYGSDDGDTSYDSDTSSAEEEYDAKYGEGSFDQGLDLYNQMKDEWDSWS